MPWFFKYLREKEIPEKALLFEVYIFVKEKGHTHRKKISLQNDSCVLWHESIWEKAEFYVIYAKYQVILIERNFYIPQTEISSASE